MRHLRIGLLATAFAGLVFAGMVQAHDLDRHGGWRGEKARYGHEVHERRAHSRGDSRYQYYLDTRQARQHRRIEDGWRSGELTRKELKRLRKNQRQIAHLERKFSADGHYSRRERQTLREALDEASGRIYRKKHNDRYRTVRHQDRGHDGWGEMFGLWSDGVGFVWYDLDS